LSRGERPDRRGWDSTGPLVALANSQDPNAWLVHAFNAASVLNTEPAAATVKPFAICVTGTNLHVSKSQ
jgi:hypothetical protein